MTTVTFATAGTTTWLCPAGVTSALTECWGGGGGASGQNGGTPGAGGGEYAAETANTVTPGVTYTIVVGAAGAGGAGTGSTAGAASSFSGTGTTTVTAHGGTKGGLSTGAAGGTGSTNGVHFNGGAGGNAPGGGGGSGGSASAGSAGTSGGVAGVTGGGPGGAAATTTGHNGSAPVSGPGGGGGGAWGNGQTGGAGFAGQVQVTYSSAVTVAGPAGGVTVAALAGTVLTLVTVAGPVATVTAAALAGLISGAGTTVAGPVANVSAAALAGLAGGSSVTVSGPVADVAATAVAGAIEAGTSGPLSSPAARASLLVDSQIELLAGGVQSSIPACAGAIFQLAPGYDLGAQQPVVDIVGELVLDGERPFGRRSSNRTITLPVVITVPSTGDQNADIATLAGARETLLQITDAQTWTLTWTRDGGYPLVFDCFRALPAALGPYSVRKDRALVAELTISFQALPYGRSDLPQLLSFASPVSGSPAPPPAPALLDAYGTVTGTHWSASSAGVGGSGSAHWSAPQAQNQAPAYSSIFAATDITGRGVLQHYAGFASARWSYLWGSSPSPVAFSYILHDSASRTISFGASVTVVQSQVITSPNWYQVSAAIPQGGSFDFTSLVRVDIQASNFSGSGLNYADLFLAGLTAQPVTTTAAASVRGSLTTLHGIKGTSHAPLSLQFEQPPAAVPSTFTLTGSGTFGPIPAGVTSINVACTGGGGAGGGLTTSGHGGGGGGGAYGQESSLAVTPGLSYAYIVGAGGTQGSSPVNGVTSQFAGDVVTVAGAGGHSAAQNSSTGGAAGAAGANAVAFAGGAGATPSTTGGGGGAAGSSATAGPAGSGVTGGAGPSGDGGNGGASGTAPGTSGTFPGGGGGGATSTSGSAIGGAGAAGTIVVTYTIQQPLFQTLIAHRPGPDSPANFTPLVSTSSVTDPPDGRQYPVPSQIAGQNARFSGTYTMIVVANSFASPSSSRTVTVTVWQTDFPGGPSTSQSVSRTFVPATDVSNGIVTIGELTLPGRDIPPDNVSMFHTIGITDTNLSDQYLDVLAIDTTGQTVIINESNPYAVFYIDEPTSDRDLGRILGSNLDRTQSVSVLDSTFVSGGPLTVDGGTDSLLLAYSTSGAPAIGVSYSPRYFMDRTD